MANPFVITAASNSVPLSAERTGQATFTVFNASGRPISGRARIVPEDPATEPWITVAGAAERAFGIAGAQQFAVEIKAPPTAPAGDVRFRLDVVDVENPDENYTQGPSVTFQVPEAPAPSKPFPWWIVAVAAGVIILLGGAFVVAGNIRETSKMAQATQSALAQTRTAAAMRPTETLTPTATATGMPTATDTPAPTPTPTIPLGFRIEDFAGTWVNVDANTSGMTRLIVRQVNNSVVSFQGFGKCAPTDCDWGVINTAFTPPRMVATWDFGYKKSIISVERSGVNLLAEVFDDYPPSDPRPDRTTNYTLRRQLVVVGTLLAPRTLSIEKVQPKLIVTVRP
jgi:hypothetical protein